MAQTSDRSLLNLIGYVAWGDLGELTMYRSRRGKLVAFKKTYPDKPVTPEAEANKTSFRIAATLYRLHGSAARQAWIATPSRLSLCLAGGALFNMAIRYPDYLALRTLGRHARTDLIANLNPQAAPPALIKRTPPRGVNDPWNRRPAAFLPDRLLIPIGQHGWTYAWCHATDLPEGELLPVTWYTSGVGTTIPQPVLNMRYNRVQVNAATIPNDGQVWCRLDWPDRPASYFHCHVTTCP